jgi:hypothetical protein
MPSVVKPRADQHFDEAQGAANGKSSFRTIAKPSPPWIGKIELPSAGWKVADEIYWIM